MKHRRRAIFIFATIVVLTVTVTERLFAQCAMCKASVSGAGNAALIKALNIGIVVLLVPPVAIFCSFFIAAIRRRGSPRGGAVDAVIEEGEGLPHSISPK